MIFRLLTIRVRAQLFSPRFEALVAFVFRGWVYTPFDASGLCCPLLSLIFGRKNMRVSLAIASVSIPMLIFNSVDNLDRIRPYGPGFILRSNSAEKSRPGLIRVW